MGIDGRFGRAKFFMNGRVPGFSWESGRLIGASYADDVSRYGRGVVLPWMWLEGQRTTFL